MEGIDLYTKIPKVAIYTAKLRYLRSYLEPAVFVSHLPREHAQINPFQNDGAEKRENLQMTKKMIQMTLKLLYMDR